MLLVVRYLGLQPEAPHLKPQSLKANAAPGHPGDMQASLSEVLPPWGGPRFQKPVGKLSTRNSACKRDTRRAG